MRRLVLTLRNVGNSAIRGTVPSGTEFSTTDEGSLGRYLKSSNSITFALAPGERSDYDISDWTWNLESPAEGYISGLEFRYIDSVGIGDALRRIESSGYSRSYSEEGPKYSDDVVRLAPRLTLPSLEAAIQGVLKRSWGPRAAVLAALSPHFPQDLRDRVLIEALALARRTPRPEDKVLDLAMLGRHLQADLRDQAFAEALKAACEIPQQSSFGVEHGITEFLRVYKMLAPNVGRDLRELSLLKILDQSQGIERCQERAWALQGLASHLPRNLLPRALDLARQIPEKSARATALTGLVPYLSQRQRQRVLDEIFDTIGQIESDKERCWEIGALAPHLPRTLLPKALDFARQIPEEEARAGALTSLIPVLAHRHREGVLHEALAAARRIPDRERRTSALKRLSTHFSSRDRKRILAEALDAARQIAEVWPRCRALRNLVAELPQELLTEALEVTRQIPDDEARAAALVHLVPCLPYKEREAAVSEALEAVVVRWGPSGAETLKTLVPYLSEELLVAGFRRRIFRSAHLTVLAPHLPPSLLSSALAAARGITGATWRAEALAAVIPRLLPPLRETVLVEALGTVRQIAGEWQSLEGWHTLNGLELLIPQLSQNLLADALEIVHGMGEEARFWGLRKLAPYLTPTLLARALGMAAAFRSEKKRVQLELDLHLEILERSLLSTQHAMSMRIRVARGAPSVASLDALEEEIHEFICEASDFLAEKSLVQDGIIGLSSEGLVWVVKFIPARYLQSFLRAGRLAVSTTPGFTWGDAVYVAPLRDAFCSMLYGRVGIVAWVDPASLRRVFRGDLRRGVALYQKWIVHQRYMFGLLTTTIHSAHANRYLRNMFRRRFDIDLVVFRPDQKNRRYTDLHKDLWFAISDWVAAKTVPGETPRYSERVRDCKWVAIVGEEFVDSGRQISFKDLFGSRDHSVELVEGPPVDVYSILLQKYHANPLPGGAGVHQIALVRTDQ